jgi:hypothetical protein
MPNMALEKALDRRVFPYLLMMGMRTITSADEEAIGTHHNFTARGSCPEI